ncbi:SDR family oxidoreductase [Rhodococcus sp. NPDC003318]|uniref:SDR family oxidoreductase n=1 Tax=Rhodococcus sp. NPDC003318 TaxID=3364503 RepID=UPI0036C7053E
MTGFAGKVVFVTGAARGVGEEVARRLHRRGARLVLVDLDAEPLTDLAAALGDRVVTQVADVTDLAAMDAAVAAGIDAFGGIDIVIANAGVASYGSVLGVDPVAFRRVVDVNILGVFHTVRAALPAIIERKGYVLVVSSLAAFAAEPGMAAYAASKAGVEHFANALRLEVAHHGVAVGSAHMGWIDTPLVRDAKADLGTFRTMLDTLPGPVGKTTSVQACGQRFEKGIERRARRIDVPGWVAAARWLRPLVQSRLAEGRTRRHAAATMSEMDAEVAALGRSVSARTRALGDGHTAG